MKNAHNCTLTPLLTKKEVSKIQQMLKRRRNDKYQLWKTKIGCRTYPLS